MPQAIVPYSYAGTMGLVQGEGMAQRFFHKLGASLLDRTICSAAGGDAIAATYGAKIGMQTRFFSESKLIVIWGSNSIASNLHFWTLAQEAKRRGAKLIAIDPRRTETAEKCHQHIALLPGTDGALALGVMHELVARQWLDHDYIARHVDGFDRLQKRIAEWPPERAAAVCGITADEVRGLARDLGTTQPAAIRLNYGMQRVHGGGNAVRLIALLPCMTGAWRHRAGGLLLSSSGWFKRYKNPSLERPDLLAGRRPRTINMSTIGDDLLREGSAGVRPEDRSADRLQQQPGGGGAGVEEGRRRLRARRPVHRRPRTFHDRHRRPCRLCAAGDDAVGAPRRARHLRPHRRDVERAGDRADRRGQAQHPDLSRAGRAHGFHRAVFRRRRRDAGAAGLRLGRHRHELRSAARTRLGEPADARRAVCRRRLCHRERQGRRSMPAASACPSMCRTTRACRRRPSWLRAFRWR